MSEVIELVRRILPSLGIVAVGIVLSSIVFTVLRSLESKNAEASFNGVAQERLDALETNVTLTVNNLVSVGALYDASRHIEREEFDRFTVPLLAGNRAIQALEWIPRVPSRSRQTYRRVNFSVAGKHDADGVRGLGLDLAQELDAIHAGHSHVGNHHRVGAVVSRELQRFLPTYRSLQQKLATQTAPIPVEDVTVVVH